MPRKPSLPSSSLLSPGGYDDDASSLRSLSEQDSDSEDDEILRGNRSTLELAEHDRTVLDEEEEMEKLLTKSGPGKGLRRIFSATGGSVKIGKRERRRRQRQEKREKQRLRKKVSEDGQLMYEMEEGYLDDESTTTPSSEMDLVDREEYSLPQSRSLPWGKLCFLFINVIVLFLIILLGAYKASSGFRKAHSHPKTLRSNGTALFAPTTILISLDGFRADYLTRGLTPTLNAFIKQGVSPPYMLPSFPSVTFPNHFTMVTGLYPESHGVVGNSFWDPVLKEAFHYTDPSHSMQPKWWNAEPLWVTAEDQGVKSAVHMWPGSEAHLGDKEPSFVDKFNGSEVLPRKTTRILELLDLPGLEVESDGSAQRPQFIAAYVPNVDAEGHRHGPDSIETRRAIRKVDDMLTGLFKGIHQRNLTDIVNIVVVSDHGMATTSTERLFQLDNFIDLELVERIDGWPLRGIRPKRPEDLQTLKDQLAKIPSNYTHAVEIYSREEMPERYHFSNNDRIAPLWVIPKTGWAIVERPEFDVQDALQTGRAYHPRGVHGYDHEHPLMRAIFVARGPAFPHSPNSRLEPFQNIHVYNILCDSLGINPSPNNGTLRLPLKVVGLHSDEGAPAPDTPDSPTDNDTDTNPVQATEPDSTEPDANPTSEDEPNRTWWGTLWDEVGDIKNWAKELFKAEKDNHPSS
ncbi:hypothetical protein ASPZODRAFT_133185 [Penicilliopsis zonata CBS 506.65]|uniref:Uncharacterized protein n=1 Tax=Penicilliopsis zonata CBS 506.65 TaxID=1073090 RepID=A0A1L9SG84_9EURO|nr:hypothetical protein ASPZODRAFT_133185 [Penicilliopsis zonata CBS 506.65]OJJ46181.1 hypothetical protein ASPZODRAFT_133185 [Penicilliopsis zonata CBS 506.65]